MIINLLMYDYTFRHGKRTIVNTDDVRLLARRNSKLVSSIIMFTSGCLKYKIIIREKSKTVDKSSRIFSFHYRQIIFRTLNNRYLITIKLKISVQYQIKT